MTLYEGLQTIHVLSVVVWVGGAFMLQILVRRVKRAGPERLGQLVQDFAAVGTRVFLPASLLLVITGFGMVGEGELDLEPWIHFGLGVWLLTFVNGAFYLGPRYGKARAQIEAEGPTPAVRTQLDRLFLVSQLELLLLALVIVAMVVKPG